MAAARLVADEAARRAGVRIAPVDDVAGIVEVERLLTRVWNAPEQNPPMRADLLRSLWHAGGATLAAYAGGSLVGAAVGVFEPPATRAAYSLVAGASPSDRGIGFALKHAQRAWALERGAGVMSWTFDPLIGRNARFNLVKLGAVAVEYLVDFYGAMDDGLNEGDETDRLTARWDLTADPPGADPGGPPASAYLGERAPDGEALTARLDGVLWCRVPADAAALRAADASAGLAWRRAVRAALAPAFDDGYRAVGMSRDGWYRLEKGDG